MVLAATNYALEQRRLLETDDGPRGVLASHAQQHLPRVLGDLIRQVHVLRARMYIAKAALQNAAPQRHPAGGFVGEAAHLGDDFVHVGHGEPEQRDLLKAGGFLAR